MALESALISHGLPRLQNLNVASEAERAVRAEGAVPATIGVISEMAKVGLEVSELEFMATAEGIPKLSARDLPSAVARSSHGVTTTTAHLAALAGIRLFVTGGLGGVHREAREARSSGWDVSDYRKPERPESRAAPTYEPLRTQPHPGMPAIVASTSSSECSRLTNSPARYCW